MNVVATPKSFPHTKTITSCNAPCFAPVTRICRSCNPVPRFESSTLGRRDISFAFSHSRACWKFQLLRACPMEEIAGSPVRCYADRLCAPPGRENLCPHRRHYRGSPRRSGPRRSGLFHTRNLELIEAGAPIYSRKICLRRSRAAKITALSRLVADRVAVKAGCVRARSPPPRRSRWSRSSRARSRCSSPGPALPR